MLIGSSCFREPLVSILTLCFFFPDSPSTSLNPNFQFYKLFYSSFGTFFLYSRTSKPTSKTKSSSMYTLQTPRD